jgi:hypothetical protein
VCELTGGSPAASAETDAVDFFPLGGLPELSLGRVLAAQIVRLHEHWRQPALPTDFD